MTKRPTISAAALLAALLGLGAIAGLPAQRRAAAQTLTAPSGPVAGNNIYFAIAEADALQIAVVDPGLPLSGLLIYSASPWGASGSLSSLGTSTADAGAPYAPSIYSLPGAVNGLEGLNLPHLPGYVASTYPAKSVATSGQPGLQLSAMSGPNQTEGHVDIGVHEPGQNVASLTADAAVTARGDGTITGVGSATVDLLQVADLLDLGGLSTYASLNEGADGTAKLSTAGSLGTITLLRKPIGATASELTLFGVGVPVPLSAQVVPVLDLLLSASGVSVEFLPANIHYTDGTSTIGQVATPHKTIKSVDTGALVLEVAGNVPSQGGVSVTYTLGRVTIAAADAPGPAVPPVNAAPAVQGPPMAGALAPTTVGPVDEPQGAVPPVIGRSSDGAVANPEVAVGIPALETKPLPSMAGLYLLFVAAAAAILLLARAGRLLAARSKHGP